MLTNLEVKNFALIQALSLAPSKQLSIITGETGAGKSILLGAISLLLGKRADAKQLLDNSIKCVIEGTFDVSGFNLESKFESADIDYDPTTVIRREILPSGKSRAFINDTPTTLEVLKSIGGTLMDIHSQHQTLLIGAESFQTQVVDNFSESKQDLANYQSAFKYWKTCSSELDALQNKIAASNATLDYNKFLFAELKAINLQDLDKESLEKELSIYENSEEIKSGFQSILNHISESEFSVLEGLNQATSSIEKLALLNKDYSHLAERMASAIIEINDIRFEIENKGESIDSDPRKTEELRNQLDTIYKLERKHQTEGIPALLKIRNDLEAELEIFENSEEALVKKSKEVAEALAKVNQLGVVLSTKRKNQTPLLSKDIVRILKSLGIPDAEFSIESSTIQPGPIGMDEINFKFSANKGIALEPLKKVASGGELSRVMFAIKLLMAGKMALPTIIFDEIDTGVSGEIALQLGELMGKMSTNHQIITITHLPQVASKAHTHFYVYKDNSGAVTNSKIKVLSYEERVDEIAQMIGGAAPTQSAIESAKELIKLSK